MTDVIPVGQSPKPHPPHPREGLMAETFWYDSAARIDGLDLSGCDGVVRYLGTSAGRHSGLTTDEVAAYQRQGKRLWTFFEKGRGDAGLGPEVGAAHAREAEALADAIGMPVWVPICYATDDDLTPAQVAPYYRAVMGTARRKAAVGGYGGFDVVESLAGLGIRWLVQTRAWSQGRVSGYAHLYQRDVNVALGSGRIDRDVVLTSPAWAWEPDGKDPRMAAPLTTDQLLAALRKWRVPLVEYGPWRDRCRCHTGSHEQGVGPRKQWGPNIGTTVHITAGDLGSRTVAQYIDNILINDPAVPLKCQLAVHDGTAYLLSAGLCNHTLFMSQSAYDALVNGTFSLTSYEDRRGDTYGRVGTLAASTFLYGIENISSAPLSAHPDDYRTSQLICAAIADAHGWSGVDEAGHGEMAIDRSYSDPGINMGLFRVGVRDLVSAGPNITPPPPPQEDDMPLTTTDISKIHDDLVAVLRAPEFNVGALKDRLAVIEGSVAALTAKVDALAPKPAGTLAPSEGGFLRYRPEAPHASDESDVYDEDDTSPGTPGVVDQPQT